jgi:DNA-binding transcriptional ArsR family regulator
MRKPDLSALPEELFSVPDSSRSTLEAELNHLGRDMQSGAGQRILEFIEQYWDWAIAPHWTSIRSSLEEEILFRGRTLAVGGPEAMLSELGGGVSWNRPILTAPYHRDLDHAVSNSKLLLVPTVFFGGMRVFVKSDSVIAMSYQVRTTALFHGSTVRKTCHEPADRLAIMIGSRRAQVMRALVMPKTTTAVAESLGLAKSTVSQHLAVLTEAGVVWRQRLGGQVFYQLDREGFLLLEHLGQR